MKYIFVGDIHGKWEVVDQALSKDGHIVFVGDYVDSFDRTTEDMETCLVTILDAVEKGKATALYGNHELSYILPDIHRCSGYSSDTDAMLVSHKQSMFRLFKTHLYIGDDWLVTHAGLHPDINRLVNLNEFELMDTKSPAHRIGRSRGGMSKIGGIYWCDFNEEFLPIPGLNQIFGHTSYKGFEIREMKGKNSVNYCIDCLDKRTEFLELELP